MQSIDVFDASVGSVYLPRPRISFSAFWLKKKGNKIEMKQPPTNKTGKKNLVKKRRECKKEDATPVVVIQNGTQRRRRLKIKFKKREKKIPSQMTTTFRCHLLWFLPCFIGFYWILLQVFAFYRILIVSHHLYAMLRGLTSSYLFILSFTGCNLVLPTHWNSELSGFFLFA